ncbi:MAG: hypothetical protein Q3993_05125 [Filifactor alocis]|nr:hypothetical protein [Filifactor alocis]
MTVKASFVSTKEAFVIEGSARTEEMCRYARLKGDHGRDFFGMRGCC